MSASPVTPPTLSIVVATRNRAALLLRLLDALVLQDHPRDDFEVIVACDGTDDDTAERARAHAIAAGPFLCVELPSWMGTGSAINAGISAASGCRILFTDDDCIPSPGWIREMNTAMDRHPLVTGSIDAPVDDPVVLAFNLNHFHRFWPSQHPGPVGFFAGANVGIRRDCLDAVGPFAEGRKVAVDTEYVFRARRSGFMPYLAPAAVTTHVTTRRGVDTLWTYAVVHAAETAQLRMLYADILPRPRMPRSWPAILLLSPLIATWVTASLFARCPPLLRYVRVAHLIWLQKYAWCIGAAQGIRHPKTLSPIV